MCYNSSTRREENHNYNALCPGNLMKPVVSAITSISEQVPLQITAQLSTTAALPRLRLGLHYLALLLIAHVFMVMGQMLTLTSCSDRVKIVSLIAELVSVVELCFCWILAFCHTHTPPLRTIFPSHTGADHLRTHPSSSASLFFPFTPPPLPPRHPPHPPPVRPPTPESD